MVPIELIAYRKWRALSQANLAKALECTRRTVSRWETGAVPIPEYVEAKVNALRINVVEPPKKVIRTLIERSGRRCEYTVFFDDGSKLGPRSWRDLPKEIRQRLYGVVGNR